jgi:pilus assembly protein CpaC
LLFGLSRAASAADGPNLIRLEITIGKSQVVELKEAFTRVSVTNPAIADVFVITPTQILINGKAVGTTSLIVFYPGRTMFFDVMVHTDVDLLRERLGQIAPRDEIQVYPTQDALVLSGNASSSLVIDQAAEIASVFAPKGKVINLLTLAEPKPLQVMLQVHIAEVVRSALRELGFSGRALAGTLIGAAFPGTPFVLGTIGGILETANQNATIVGASTPDFGFQGQNIFLSSPNRDYAGVVHALAERNLLRTLAKPNLVTQSGKEAKFISGGEFPYPVAISSTAIGVEFKEFGTGLVFTPVVVDGETISLRLLPIVSELDFANGVRASNGLLVPSIRKNQAFTTISLKDGESFAIAGLIKNNVRQLVDKIPLLGDIPVLGALFRSTSFRNDESELVFLVTVKIVKPTAPGVAEAPDPLKILELREKERKEFTLIPGIPGVGNPVDRPFGESNLERR